MTMSIKKKKTRRDDSDEKTSQYKTHNILFNKKVRKARMQTLHVLSCLLQV